MKKQLLEYHKKRAFITHNLKVIALELSFFGLPGKQTEKHLPIILNVKSYVMKFHEEQFSKLSTYEVQDLFQYDCVASLYIK